MKKIYITNDNYSIDKVINNHKIIKVDYLFKGNEVIKYYAYEMKDNSKTDNDYLNIAKKDFHKFKKTRRSILYSYKYLFKETSTPKRRIIIGSIQSLLLLGIIIGIILISIFAK